MDSVRNYINNLLAVPYVEPKNKSLVATDFCTCVSTSDRSGTMRVWAQFPGMFLFLAR